MSIKKDKRSTKKKGLHNCGSYVKGAKRINKYIKFMTIVVIMLSLLFALPLFATADLDNEEIYITYGSIQERVLENNLQLKISRVALNKMKKNLDDAEESSEDNSIINQISVIERSLSEIGGSTIGNIDTDVDDLRDEFRQVNENQSTLNNNLRKMAATSSGMLQLYYMNFQIQSQALKDNIDSLGDQIDLTEMNIEQAEKTLVNSAKNLYLIYHQLTVNLKQIENSKSMLNAQLESAKVSHEQGIVKQNVIMGLETSLMELDASQRSLDHQREVILLQAKNLMGYTYEDKVFLGSLPLLDEEFIYSIKFDEDAKVALTNANSIKIKDKELKNASTGGKRRSYELQIKENEAYLSFLKQYQSLLEKNDALDISKSKLANAMDDFEQGKKSFEKGIISQSDLDVLDNDVKLKEAEVNSNSIALICEIENYKAMKEGAL